MEDSVVRRDAASLKQGEPANPAAACLESLESLERRLRTAEKERDALNTLGQEELYLGSCLRVSALERQLEARLLDPTGTKSLLPHP